jgi:hypothetical protein
MILIFCETILSQEIGSYLTERYVVRHISLLFSTEVRCNVNCAVWQLPSLAVISTVGASNESVYVINVFFYYIQVENEKKKCTSVLGGYSEITVWVNIHAVNLKTS